MTPRRERRAFVAAAFGLWLLFFVQAVLSPVLLDDWFQLRFWRDHELGLGALWSYAHHNYFHYNPRIGETFLAIIDGSRAIHVIATPLVQVAALVTVFVIAFGRWPRQTLRDLQLLLFIQTMIWLVIPIPGLMYFYRPYATNYLWGFTVSRSRCSCRIGFALGAHARPRATGSCRSCSCSAGSPACATSTPARRRWSRWRASATRRGTSAGSARWMVAGHDRALRRVSDADLRARPDDAVRRDRGARDADPACLRSAGSRAASRSCANSWSSHG